MYETAVGTGTGIVTETGIESADAGLAVEAETSGGGTEAGPGAGTTSGIGTTKREARTRREEAGVEEEERMNSRSTKPTNSGHSSGFPRLNDFAVNILGDCVAFICKIIVLCQIKIIKMKEKKATKAVMKVAFYLVFFLWIFRMDI